MLYGLLTSKFEYYIINHHIIHHSCTFIHAHAHVQLRSADVRASSASKDNSVMTARQLLSILRLSQCESKKVIKGQRQRRVKETKRVWKRKSQRMKVSDLSLTDIYPPFSLPPSPSPSSSPPSLRPPSPQPWRGSASVTKCPRRMRRRR